MNPTKQCKLLSIDAWRDSNGWTWNQWFDTGERVPLEAINWSPRKLLKYLRTEAPVLSAESAGKVAIDDAQFNIVIVERSSREPLYAIEYGPHI